jgi:short-subunit dehydrogenase
VLYLLRCLQAHPTTPKIDVSIICPGFVQTPLTARNDFAMPFMIGAKQAATYILNGILKRQKEISFPRSLVFIFKLIAILPDFLRIRILSRISSKK